MALVRNRLISREFEHTKAAFRGWWTMRSWSRRVRAFSTPTLNRTRSTMSSSPSTRPRIRARWGPTGGASYTSVNLQVIDLPRGGNDHYLNTLAIHTWRRGVESLSQISNAHPAEDSSWITTRKSRERKICLMTRSSRSKQYQVDLSSWLTQSRIGRLCPFGPLIFSRQTIRR